MEFIENNYIWIIVIGVIVLMTIIGYFADKSEKKEKVPKEKKQKKNNDVKEEIPEVDETTDIDNSFASEWDENNKPVEEENEVINIEGAETTDWNTLPDTEETNVEPLEETPEESPMDWDTEISNDVETEEEPIFTGSMEQTESEQPESVEVSDTELTENPVSVEDEEISNEAEVPTETVDEPIDELNELEITLPNIETLNEEIKDVEDDEDVWKF